jgi:uncharacterized protein
MSLTNDEREAIVYLRIQKARDTLKEAEGIATLGYWNAVANRLYYACYYITSSLLVKNNYAAQTHRGVIRLLGMHFIKTGIVPDSAGKLYTKLFELRQTGDYDDMSDLTEDDVKPLIVEVQNYLNVISALLGD